MPPVSTARKLSILGRIARDHAGRNRTVNALWQAGMAEYFLSDAANPDEQMQPLFEYFHLE